MAIYFAVYLGNVKKGPAAISYSDFIALAKEGKIDTVTVMEDQKRIDGTYVLPAGSLKDAKHEAFFTFIGSDPEMWKFLREKNVNVTVKAPEQVPLWLSILVNVGPLLILQRAERNFSLPIRRKLPLRMWQEWKRPRKN